MTYLPFKKCSNILSFFPNIEESIDYASKCVASNNLSTWFSEAPKFTTFRVNTLVITVEDVIQFLKDSLENEAASHNVATPEIFKHSTLHDCIVISSWNEQFVEPEPFADEVIVDAACGAAVLRGADVFAPGVMGMSNCVCEGSIVNVYADIAGKCLRGLLIPYIENKVFLGCGEVRMARRQLFEGDKHPNGIAVEMKHRVSGVPRLYLPPTYGLLQNLPSILCCHVLNPQCGQKVLDMCAGPGNKTTHLATLMQNKGKLFALDKTQHKVDSILSLCERLSVTCVEAFLCDSTRAVADCAEATLGPPFAPCTFSCILLDAPCSALGQRPQLINNISAKQINSYPPLQKKLFRNAVCLLKSGGTLVYSTCTMTLAENEDIVQWALDQYPELVLVPAEPILGKPGSSQNGLAEQCCQMLQRFGPPGEVTPDSDTIGFFIAKFLKL